jgi:heme/copper-type cytochrome/quinol oxidase subunit 4
MKRSIPLYDTLVWVFLIVITCASWEITRGLELFGDHRFVTSIVLLIAFIKTRFVLLDFMELKHAPLLGRLFAELWCGAILMLLLVLYWTSDLPIG